MIGGLDGMQPQPGPPLTQSKAAEMMDQIVHWVRKDPAGLGRPWLPGAPASESMAVPMVLLSLVKENQELETGAGSWDWRLMPVARQGLGARGQGHCHPTPHDSSSAHTTQPGLVPFTVRETQSFTRER